MGTIVAKLGSCVKGVIQNGCGLRGEKADKRHIALALSHVLHRFAEVHGDHIL